jgi:hypothetical protein
VPELIEHWGDCYPGSTCVECGGCECGAIESTCDGPGCYSRDAHDQWHDEMGSEECCYG